MSLNTQTKQKILSLIQNPVPTGIGIVEKSVPIPFFGDIENARFATISLNPSYKEFVDDNKVLLSGYKKRLVDRDVLLKQDTDVLSTEEAEQVFNSLKMYFKNSPYNMWFNWLETNAGNVFNASYYNGSMVNLDIYPWATKSNWSALDESVRNFALKSYKLLQEILLSDTALFDCVYINGNGVKKQLENVCGIKINELKIDDWTIYHYMLPNGLIMIGSNKYIQNAYLSRERMAELQSVLKQVLKDVYNKVF